MNATTIVGTVWKSADRRENRWVRVESTDVRYAYVATCDPRGVIHEKARRTRIQLDNRGGLRGYRKVER